MPDNDKDVERYDHAEIEPRWQEKWQQDGLYQSDIDPAKPKHYALTMLPYPSGDLHIGHWYAMTPSDARARFMRMRGYNVMFPMGFDAFGLPAENAAIKRNIHPKEWTYANVGRMRDQLKSMGAMYDWRREAVSSDPKYYHWTQWFFLKLFENELAYRKEAAVDWCPSCNTTLAREQVITDDRVCERCGTQVTRKELEQWFFRTTNYVEELLDFSDIDWPDRVETLQTNWIGRSEGASVVFHTEGGDPMEVFTTRPDTLWGATFMVLAPEHPLVEKLASDEQKEEVHAYVHQALRQSDIQREAIDKEKSGVFTGGYAVNPVNQARIPIWIADYVLMSYGTGAIMGVPAHDERDFEFALKFGLPILPVIKRTDDLIKAVVPVKHVKSAFDRQMTERGYVFSLEGDNYHLTLSPDQVDSFANRVQESLDDEGWASITGGRWVIIFAGAVEEWTSIENGRELLERIQSLDASQKGARTLMEVLWSETYYHDALYHHEYGDMINSGKMSGTPGTQAFDKTIDLLEAEGSGKRAVNYRLRDWLISRQRYWGAPIPMVHCPKCGIVPLPEDQLPVLLPDDVEWLPTGESPLKIHPTWKEAACPKCGEDAERETDTMDTFMCSSWYHLRYLSPEYDQGPFDPKEYEYWMPVDTYTGGIEHATMHLIYTRFFHKAGRDMGITQGSEPMLQLRNQGIVLGEDSEKMSKSRGNVISPDDLVAAYGADTVRAYLMFFARWDLGGPWNSSGIEGSVRWVRRVWTLLTEPAKPGDPDATERRALRRKVHQTLRQVTRDFEAFEFNTIISALMELLNEMYRQRELGAAGTPEWDEAVDIYLRMMAPVAPHVTEELWDRLGKPYSVHQQTWPEIDEEAAKEDEITLVVQINGKVRDRITLPAGFSQDEAREVALQSDVVKRHLEGKEPRKVIVVPGKLVNIVV